MLISKWSAFPSANVKTRTMGEAVSTRRDGVRDTRSMTRGVATGNNKCVASLVECKDLGLQILMN